MRVLTIFAGIALTLVVAIATSGSALSQQNKPAGTAGAPAQGQAVAPTKPGKPGGVQSDKATGGLTVAPLTEAECRGLGGKPAVDAAGCASGSMCIRADQDGVLHRSCITVKQ